MRKIWLFLIAICLGGVTLGLGLGAGYAFMRHFTPEPEVVTIEVDRTASVTTVHVNPLAIPIDPNEPSFVDVIPLVKDSVVSINVTAAMGRGFGRGEAPGAGSGFIFAEDGDYVFIATNNHVIENATSVTISLDDNENVPAVPIGWHRDSDLAVLAVSKAALEAKGVPFTVAVFGDSDIMRMGDPVVAIGNAMGEGQTVTRGIISALNLNINIDDPHTRYRLNLDVMQTDAAVNRGNSGGPLVNRHGEVIGIVTAKLLGADIEGMGYALPINNVVPVLLELKENGSARQPFIGIRHEEMSEARAASFNLPAPGILIRAVFPDSPAEAAGLQVNDLIVSFGGIRIAGFDDFVAALALSRPGNEVVFGVYRGRERLDITVTLGSIIR
ncbi:MAG: trypsin-like peptidase domain-containing protein [Defluviitaleaceae bacterium]|nr:trypsin-like peptidase domain-containing protein [Defluviitaleaceae bacterium]MCL2215719.1 trypsin-like peptidase domain-containing protein [Defluviitaleaceae bacterium]